jgi:hypothetical protein
MLFLGGAAGCRERYKSKELAFAPKPFLAPARRRPLSIRFFYLRVFFTYIN